jgi:hypothetical protein
MHLIASKIRADVLVVSASTSPLPLIEVLYSPLFIGFYPLSSVCVILRETKLVIWRMLLGVIWAVWGGREGSQAVEIFIDVMFMLDICLSFVTSYEDQV